MLQTPHWTFANIPLVDPLKLFYMSASRPAHGGTRSTDLVLRQPLLRPRPSRETQWRRARATEDLPWCTFTVQFYREKFSVFSETIQARFRRARPNRFKKNRTTSLFIQWYKMLKDKSTFCTRRTKYILYSIISFVCDTIIPVTYEIITQLPEAPCRLPKHYFLFDFLIFK